MRKKLLALVAALALGGTSAFADNIEVHGAIVAGSAFALTPTTGDLEAARSAQAGAIVLGGATHSCTIDFGVSTSNTLTVPCAAVFSGGITNTGNGIFTGAVVAGSGTAAAPTSGDMEASRSTTAGELILGGTSSSCAIDYGVTTASKLTIPCVTQVNGALSSTGAIVAGSANGTALAAGDLVAARNSNTGAVTLGGSTHCTLFFDGTNVNVNSCGLVVPGNITSTSGIIRSGTAIPASIANGDLVANRSSSTGALFLGGNGSACEEDYGLTSGATVTFNCAVTATGIVHSNAALTSGGYVAATTNVIAGNSNVPSVHGGSTFGVGTDTTDTPRALEVACVTSPGACGYGTNSLASVSGISGEQACFGPVPNTVCKVTFDHLGNIGAKSVASSTTPYIDFNGSLVAAATAHWEIQVTTLSTNPQTVNFTTAFAFAPDCTVSVNGGAGASGHVAVTGTSTTTGVPIIDTATDIVTTMCYGV